MSRLGRVALLVTGAVVLALLIADVPLARLAHQSVNASGGSLPVWVSAALAAVGFVLAWRKPRNPLGWMFLAAAFFAALSEDASFYMVADYRLRHGGLPLGWVAVLAQPGWAPALTLLGLSALLFPDGRPPSRRWRWVLWLYLAAGTLWVTGTAVVSVLTIAGHDVRVDPSGNLTVLDQSIGATAWWGVVQTVFVAVVGVCLLGSVTAQAASYRRSSGERRQQIKWLLAGTVLGAVSFGLDNGLSAQAGVLSATGGVVSAICLAGLPVCMGVAIMRYRLFDIDRIISRTLAYAIVTGLLVGVYAGIVLLATRVVSITTPVAVAGSTLAVAALFNPVRRRVQRTVDRRFNRSRYDADRIVAAFAARLQDAVDPDSIQDELAGTVHNALEPVHLSVWLA
jgi:hypothetical protein